MTRRESAQARWLDATQRARTAKPGTIQKRQREAREAATNLLKAELRPRRNRRRGG